MGDLVPHSEVGILGKHRITLRSPRPATVLLECSERWVGRSVSRHPISPLALNLGHLTRSRLRTGQGVVTFVGLTAAQQFFISSGGAG